MQLDEPIYLADYDLARPVLFAQESLALQPIFALRPAVFEHMGSTAVPGLVAKPVVGIGWIANTGAQCRSIERGAAAWLRLFLGEAGVPDRMYSRKRTPTAFNLHVVELASEHWRNNAALRDYLRTHWAEATR